MSEGRARRSRQMSAAETPRVLGWREWVALPELGIPAIKAKVDTGARSSALHASDVEIIRRGQKRLARFKVHPFQRDTGRTVVAEAELIDHRRVRTSGGGADVRPVIRTVVEIAGRRWTIDVTLAGREAMGFRMLLGRQAIRRRFLVDPGGSFLAGGAPRPHPRSGRKS